MNLLLRLENLQVEDFYMIFRTFRFAKNRSEFADDAIDGNRMPHVWLVWVINPRMMNQRMKMKWDTSGKGEGGGFQYSAAKSRRVWRWNVSWDYQRLISFAKCARDISGAKIPSNSICKNKYIASDLLQSIDKSWFLRIFFSRFLT